MSVADSGPASAPPSFGQALRFWAKLGFINFGGPAGQIAIMQEELVERKRWIGHARFMHALNFCMLLPGPEAMQLATYVGWLLNGTPGGLAAGTLFVLPGAILMLGLAVTYSLYGDVAWVRGVFYGLGPAVIAMVGAAVIRIGRKSLNHRALYAIAVASFAAIFFFAVPFPLIVLAAALIGMVGCRARPAWFKPAGHEPPGGSSIDDLTSRIEHTRPTVGRALRLVLVHAVLWAGPIAALGFWRGWDDNFVTIAVFFSIAAMVTFGGAYAVLSYVAQSAVGRYAWLTPHDMTTGLGMAESTPGPLILVVQFVGYLAAFHHAPHGWSRVAAGMLGAAITLWVTFVPCFMWIFVGAPYIEGLRGRRVPDAAMTAVTASVVGVVLNLAVWLALRVLFGEVAEREWGALVLNVPTGRTLDPAALAMSVVGFVGIARFKWNMMAVVLAYAVLGLTVHLLR